MKNISVIIPTFNSSVTIGDCLDSIISQNYDKKRIEIIIADAGSTDGTLDLVRSRLSSQTGINYKISKNPLRTGEAGKAVGIRLASNELIALIDSDNILPGPDWLGKMVSPFSNPDVIASEPLYYTYRKQDSFITRYCALLGMNDVLCLFIGNYDRYNSLTRKWTEMPHEVLDRGDYLEIGLKKEYLPTIGANGFIIRKYILDKCRVEDYLFDIDIIYQILSEDKNTKVAKVKTGIIHVFSKSIFIFVKKQRRRIRDFLYFRSKGQRQYPWQGFKKSGPLKFAIYGISIFPLLTQAWKGYVRTNRMEWSFHPIAVWITLGTYGIEYLKYKNKELFKKAGDVFMVLFIFSLLGIACSMFFKNENVAEKLGNAAYISLLLGASMKFIYSKL